MTLKFYISGPLICLLVTQHATGCFQDLGGEIQPETVDMTTGEDAYDQIGLVYDQTMGEVTTFPALTTLQTQTPTHYTPAAGTRQTARGRSGTTAIDWIQYFRQGYPEGR